MSNQIPHPSNPERLRWWQEPLFHFAVLGALLFAVDSALVSRNTDPKTIVVDAAVVDEARNVFRSASKREPNARELETLTRRWIDNEILFREGIALGVDQGDKMIRDRVNFKSLMLMETGLQLPAIDDVALREWFEIQRNKYDEPVRFDFQEAVLSDDNGEAAARAFVKDLNTEYPAIPRPGCGSSRAGHTTTWCRATGRNSPSCSRPGPWASGVPCPHRKACG